MSSGWTQDLALGVEEIDYQHQLLFDKLENLIIAMDKGVAQQEIPELFDFLAEYVRIHFSAEEELMQRYHYPNFPQHKVQHDYYTSAVRLLRQEWQAVLPGSDATPFVFKVRQQLKEWLTNHILTVDMRFGEFLMVQT